MKLIQLFSMILATSGMGYAEESETVYRPGDVKQEWRVICDTVMGGRSKGEVKEGKVMVFSGKVSLENNGGFASMRSVEGEMDLSKFDGLRLKLMGTGRTFYVSLRVEGLGRVAYWAPIETKKGEWVEVMVPFENFKPTFFGKELKGPKLNTAKLTSVGFMLYDKEAGDFELKVKEIVAVKK